MDGVSQFMRLRINISKLAVETLQHISTLTAVPEGAESPACFTPADFAIDVFFGKHIFNPVTKLLVKRRISSHYFTAGIVPRIGEVFSVRQRGHQIPVAEFIQPQQFSFDAQISLIEGLAFLYRLHQGGDSFLIDIIVFQTGVHRISILAQRAHAQVVVTNGT